LEPPPEWLQISRFPREQQTVAQRLSTVPVEGAHLSLE
jgi:hypothetical protein